MMTEEMNQIIEDKDCVRVDCDTLPDLVWLKVMELLPLPDRYHISTTCSRLCKLFHSPVLWRSAHLTCRAADFKFRVGHKAALADGDKQLIARFGHLFEHVSFQIIGLLVDFEEDTARILKELQEKWCLRSLVLDIGTTNSRAYRADFELRKTSLSLIADMMFKSPGLVKLEILCWPQNVRVSEDNELNITRVLLAKDHMKNLHELNLFWKKGEWTDLSVHTPPPQAVVLIVSKFELLQHLHLRHTMLSCDLLRKLSSSKRQQLYSLSILLSHQPFRSNLTSTAWSDLVKACPSLQVHVTIISRVADSHFTTMFKPEVPLTTVQITKFSRCSAHLLNLLKEFKRSLLSFVCKSDTQECEEALLSLIESYHATSTPFCTHCPPHNCMEGSMHIKEVNPMPPSTPFRPSDPALPSTQLSEGWCECKGVIFCDLVFHGIIHSETVCQLAGLSARWQRFEFAEKNILTTPHEKSTADDDTVIRKDVDGKFVLASIERTRNAVAETKEDRKEELERMCSCVSQKLGLTSWKPV